MAKLTFIEKDYFERLFGMNSGYILGFSNRTFQEFVYSIMQIDIYLKYQGLSKAKILRAIITEYDNVTVGKLLLELLRYMQSMNMVADNDKETFKKCAEIGNRLIGKSSSFKEPKSTTVESKPITILIDYDKFLKELQMLTTCEDSPQARGFAFEKYLKIYSTSIIFNLEVVSSLLENK